MENLEQLYVCELCTGVIIFFARCLNLLMWRFTIWWMWGLLDDSYQSLTCINYLCAIWELFRLSRDSSFVENVRFIWWWRRKEYILTWYGKILYEHFEYLWFLPHISRVLLCIGVYSFIIFFFYSQTGEVYIVWYLIYFIDNTKPTSFKFSFAYCPGQPFIILLQIPQTCYVGLIVCSTTGGTTSWRLLCRYSDTPLTTAHATTTEYPLTALTGTPTRSNYSDSAFTRPI